MPRRKPAKAVPVGFSDHIGSRDGMSPEVRLRELVEKYYWMRPGTAHGTALAVAMSQDRDLFHDVNSPPGGRSAYINVYGMRSPRIKIRVSDHSWSYGQYDYQMLIQTPDPLELGKFLDDYKRKDSNG
jgi:hypothetical protein